MHNYQDNHEEQYRELLERYEGMLHEKSGEGFFDTDEFETIIDHYINENQLNKATGALSRGLSIHPVATGLLARKGQLLALQQKPRQALQYIDRALNLEPTNADYWVMLAGVYDDLDEYEEAEDCFYNALYNTSEPEDIHLMLGAFFMDAERFIKAAHHFKEALSIDFHNIEAIEELAICYGHLGQGSKIIRLYQRFIDENPYSYVAWDNLGATYYRLGRLDEAYQAFEFAITINENFAQAWLDMGKLLVKKEAYHEAIAVYEKCLTVDEDEAVIHLYLASCWQKLKDYAKARGHFKKALGLDPDMDEALFGIAETYESERRYHYAIYYINRALELFPYDAMYWRGLVRCQALLHNMEESLEAYEKGLECIPEAIQLWIDYALALLDLDEADECIDALKEAIKINPEAADLYFVLAGALYDEHLLEEAEDYFNGGLCLDKSRYLITFDHFPHLCDEQRLLQHLQNHQ